MENFQLLSLCGKESQGHRELRLVGGVDHP